MNTLELLRHEGRIQGLQEGREEGRIQGLQEGREEAAVRRTAELVLSSFKHGLDIQLIGKIMEISTDQVREILQAHQL